MSNQFNGWKCFFKPFDNDWTLIYDVDYGINASCDGYYVDKDAYYSAKAQITLLSKLAIIRLIIKSFSLQLEPDVIEDCIGVISHHFLAGI